jgi:phage terminase large subunit-like protein
MITISTAGDDEDSALGRMRTSARSLQFVKRDGAYTYARNADRSYVMHEWALEAGADRDDMGVVKAANPASWQTVEALRRRHESPSMTPWQWARFACGVWLQGENTAIDPLEWAACAVEAREMPSNGEIVRLGVDVGWKIDCTAVVPHWLDDDGTAHLGEPKVLRADREGSSLRKGVILDALREMRELYGADEVVIDPENDGEVLAQDLEELGFDVIAHSQKPAPMALAAERFSAAVRERKLCHPGDAVLTRHVLNAHSKSTEDGRWRFVKESKQSSKHIDALIAAAMVHSVAVGEALTDDTPFIFEIIS